MASVTFVPWRPTERKPQSWRRYLAAHPALQVALYATLALCGVTLSAEAALRGLEAWYEQPVTRVFASAKPLEPGAAVGDRTVNALGYLDDEFDARPHPGKVRIALLGGRATLAGCAVTNIAAQLERKLPFVEIDVFGLPEGNPGEYAARLRRDVIRFNPQFVLVCLSSADDVAATVEPPRSFDVRLLSITRSITDPLAGRHDPALAARRLAEPVDYETYVRRRVSPIAVCRKGDDAALERRWNAAQAGLEKLTRRCRDQNIGVGVVLAPSDFQLNPTLAEALRRRAGVEADRFDVELPQRRWSALVDHLQLPSLDLLPTFRAADAVLFETASPDWNEQGRTLAAATTARWLQSRLGDAVADAE